MNTLQLLSDFVSQRPGLDYRDYGDITAYRSDARRITQQLHDARELLRYCHWKDVEVLPEHFRSAFMGRLELAGDRLEYTTGQYYPMEYRAAVCAVLAYAIRRHWYDVMGYDRQTALIQARAWFRRGLVTRWFD